MSDLQAICDQVQSVAGEMKRWAGDLEAQASKIRRTASQAQATTKNGGQGNTVAPTLDAAARQCQQAAAALLSAQVAAGRFVDQHGARGGGGRTDATNSGDASVSSGGAPSLGDIQGWLAEVNPGFNGDPFDPRSSNCGKATLAVFNKLEGNGLRKADLGTLSISEMEAATGRPQVSMSSSEIERRLVEAGPGSHAVVGVDRSSGPGHWFNAYYDGNRVVAIDGQSNSILDWPPDYGSVIHWDVGI